MREGRRRPVPALVGACLLAAACTSLGNQADEGAGRTVNGGGALLGLRSADGVRDQRRHRSDQFCGAVAAAAVGADLLDCQLVPLGNVASTVCVDPSRPTVRDDRDPFADLARCQPLLPAVASQAVGWSITERDRRRELSIYLGPLPDRATPATSSTPPQPTLVERFRADDDANRWSELAVCPADLDADGINELVVLTRPWDDLERIEPDESERPEIVAVWLQPPMRAGASPAPLRTLVVSRPVPRDRGEGCASPVVRTLRFDDGQLRADLGVEVPRPPAPLGVAR
jgi:hypothetical protein